ncbi:hypothetical protein M9435_005642 [Picochlorum sp. BPE23]|nr:hypothetical protein M9435_005642 [Picochlorum sp. BPE23]
MTLALVFRGAVQRFLENMGIAYSNELSPITIVSLGIFGVSVCVLLLQTVLFGIILPIRRQVGKLFSIGEQDSLETLNTKLHSKTTQKNNTSSKAKNTKKKKKKTNSSTTTTSRKQEDNNKESEANSEQQQQHGMSLKALKRMEKESKKSDAASGMKQHESNLFLETINSKHRTEEVTGLSLCGSYMVTACKDREIRVFAVATTKEGRGSVSSAKKAPSWSLVAHHIVRAGVFDVVCLEVEEQAMLVAFITYGPHTTVEVHTARISLDPKHPSMDILDKAPKIFAPKIDFGPLLLTGSSTRLVAASKKPRVAALDVAKESLQSLKNIDTNSILNNDVAVSPDGSIVCVATFSSDVPVFALPEGKKLTSLSGHKKRVTGVAISPDGTRVATASDDLTLRLWNIDVRHHLQEDPVCLARVGLPCASGLAHMSWVGPNSIAGVAGHDVYIFDASTGKVQHSILEAHMATITCLEPSLKSAVGDGVFATGGEDGLVRVWKVPCS